jgi:head-tail adaptor
LSKSANAGELRIPIYFKKKVRETDSEGFPTESETDVFGCAIYAKWSNAHGSESFTALQLQLREPATITCRYSPLINERLDVYKAGDSMPYEIISIDNVEQKNQWLEIKAQRKEAAR